MFDKDPDNIQRPILDSTAQSFEVPANKGAYLHGSFNASWEQAAIVYADGARVGQIGSYNRPTFLVVGKKPTKQTVTIAGWHKRGGPNGSLPWNASRGRKAGNIVIGFDDSGDDGDFNDCIVKVVID